MTHHSDTDHFDDLRHIAGLALSRAGKTGPVREGLQLRIDRLEAWLREADKQHGELLTELEESVPRETPLSLQTGNDQPWSLRECLSKLVEAADILLHQKDYDGAHWELIQSAWTHGKGYIDGQTQSVLRQEPGAHVKDAIRPGGVLVDSVSPPGVEVVSDAHAPTVTDEQLAADIAIVHETVRQPINSAEAYDLDAIHAFDRIAAALAARGVK